jgi:L-fucose dehydrogenase
VIVTGGAKGIGAAITRALAKERAVPVILDRDAAAAESLRAELSRDGLPSHFIQIDLCSAADCAAAIERTLSVANRLNALVNNAGVNDGVGLEKGGPEEFVVSLGRNLLHYYNMAHYALPSLKAATGAIVNIASKVAFTGQGGTSGYAASKGAILALTREWAAELLPSGVRVNTIVPADVMTPPYRQWLDTFQTGQHVFVDGGYVH